MHNIVTLNLDYFIIENVRFVKDLYFVFIYLLIFMSNMLYTKRPALFLERGT